MIFWRGICIVSLFASLVSSAVIPKTNMIEMTIPSTSYRNTFHKVETISTPYPITRSVSLPKSYKPLVNGGTFNAQRRGSQQSLLLYNSHYPILNSKAKHIGSESARLNGMPSESRIPTEIDISPRTIPPERSRHEDASPDSSLQMPASKLDAQLDQADQLCRQLLDGTTLQIQGLQ